MIILPHWPDFPWENVEEVDRGFIDGPCSIWTKPWRAGSTLTRRDGSPYAPSITGHRQVRRLLMVAVGEPDRSINEVWMHRCEVYGETNLCVDPSHIRIGRKGENNSDRLFHERRAGLSHSTSKLMPEQVEEIRLRYAAGGVTQRVLGEEYGVTQTVISDLIRGKAHRHHIGRGSSRSTIPLSERVPEELQ